MAGQAARAYLAGMSDIPDFLDHGRPAVPDLVVPRGVLGFHLPLRPVRGRLVRLGPLADALLTRHDHHPVVARLVGEALALAAALATALKFRGSFSVQSKGDGPVRTLLADCTELGALRSYARVDAEALAALLAREPAPDAGALMGNGYLAFSVDQGPDRERHQGIVAISGASLADMTGHYFETSEQLRSFVYLAAASTADGWRAGALVLERIAGGGGVDPMLDAAGQEESWRTALTLAGTLTDGELLDDALPAERLLFRLFGAEGVATSAPRALAFGCRCSRARLAEILESFRAAELDEMQTEGEIVMNCEFCNVGFGFPRTSLRGRG